MIEIPSNQATIPYNNIGSGSSTNGYVDKLIYFLEEHYASFPKEYKVALNESEEDISEKLYLHLQRKSRLTDAPFEFQPETPQKLPTAKGHKKELILESI